jgi:hypothetical protein
MIENGYSILFNLIIKTGVESGKTKAYDPLTDEFLTELTAEQIKEKMGDAPLKVLRFKIKEDWFYNSALNLAETRIIGICPVVVEPVTGKVSDLFWIYYPEIKDILASEKIKTANPTITNIDDVLEFRDFDAEITKESNIHNRALADYKSGKSLHDEAALIETGMIDAEHDYWIALTSK